MDNMCCIMIDRNHCRGFSCSIMLQLGSSCSCACACAIASSAGRACTDGRGNDTAHAGTQREVLRERRALKQDLVDFEEDGDYMNMGYSDGRIRSRGFQLQPGPRPLDCRSGERGPSSANQWQGQALAGTHTQPAQRPVCSPRAISLLFT